VTSLAFDLKLKYGIGVVVKNIVLLFPRTAVNVNRHAKIFLIC